MTLRSYAVSAACAVVIGCTMGVTVKAINVLVDVGAFYAHPDQYIRYQQALSRSADSTLNMCSSFAKVFSQNPQIGELPPRFVQVCVDHLPEIQQLVAQND